MKFDEFDVINGIRIASIYNKYVVYETGEILNLKKGNFMKPRISNGQAVISIYNEGNQHTYSIARLVAEAFVEKPNDKEEFVVIHKDGDPFNNNCNNLMWSSRLEHNRKNFLKNLQNRKLKKQGKKIKLINKIECIEIEFNSIVDAAKYLVSINTKLTIGGTAAGLCQALNRGGTCHGWKVIECEKSRN